MDMRDQGVRTKSWTWIARYAFMTSAKLTRSKARNTISRPASSSGSFTVSKRRPLTVRCVSLKTSLVLLYGIAIPVLLLQAAAFHKRVSYLGLRLRQAILVVNSDGETPGARRRRWNLE